MPELLAFLAVGLSEYLVPWRQLPATIGARWITNFALVGANAIVAFAILPGGLAGIALYAEKSRIGLFPWAGLPSWLQFVIGLLILDLTAYGLHRLLHYVHLFWRFHAIHHADPEVDGTTGFRHHPGELILTTLGMISLVITCGIPVLAVVAYSTVSAFLQIAQHGNLRVPRPLDEALRLLLVTPGVHRLHHSIDPREGNRNFGTGLVWWDRLFGTYLPHGRVADTELEFGVHGFKGVRDLAPWRVLAMPFLIRKNQQSRRRATFPASIA